MNKLSIKDLIENARQFCEIESQIERKELYAITDGKAVGTFVEHLFQNYLKERFDLTIGSSANGLDLPSINTDIKVTSIAQPQSSCPFRDSKQKIFGLGYNLLVFVYRKKDNHSHQTSTLEFVSCSFIDKSRSADYQTTTGLLSILENEGNEEDIFAFLNDRNIPADEITLLNIAREIINNPPLVGYLTISNALQWRLQYKRIVTLEKEVEGVIPIIKYNG